MVFVLLNVVIVTAQTSTIPMQEKDGFRWKLVLGYGTVGAQDINGNTIIPLSRQYVSVNYSCSEGDPPFFFVLSSKNKFGVCTVKGKEIIAPKYSNLVYHEGQFWYEIGNNEWQSTDIALNSRGTDSYSYSSSKLGKAVAIGAGITIAGLLIKDAFDNSSSKSSSNKAGNSSNTNKYSSSTKKTSNNNKSSVSSNNKSSVSSHNNKRDGKAVYSKCPTCGFDGTDEVIETAVFRCPQCNHIICRECMYGVECPWCGFDSASKYVWIGNIPGRD